VTERWVVLLAGVVGAVPFLVSGHKPFAVLAICVGIYFAGKVRPFRDPVRLFSEDDRMTIWKRAEGFCENCGVPTHYESRCPFGGCAADYQADHVVPWSKGGRTLLANGACLCQRCNAAKSDR
jgi:hypothetical protein